MPEQPPATDTAMMVLGPGDYIFWYYKPGLNWLEAAGDSALVLPRIERRVR